MLSHCHCWNIARLISCPPNKHQRRRHHAPVIDEVTDTQVKDRITQSPSQVDGTYKLSSGQ